MRDRETYLKRISFKNIVLMYRFPLIIYMIIKSAQKVSV